MAEEECIKETLIVLRETLLALREAEEDLRLTVAKIDEELNDLGIDINMEDDEPFLKDDDKTLSLALMNGKFRILADYRRTGELNFMSLRELSLNDMLALIRSGRLTKFLAKVCEELNRKASEVKEALEEAEEILNALR